jgi:RND family efflux transporter MFP subunit
MTSKPEAASPDAREGPPQRPPRSAGWRAVVIVLQILLVLVVLVGGTMLAAYLIATGPEAKRKPPAPRARLVDVEEAAFARHRTAVQAMGTVCPARSVVLHPRVGGEIVEVAKEFLPGGRFRAGETILRIEPEDYQLAVARRELALKQSELAIEQSQLATDQKQSTVARTESDLKLERGQQAIARREFELLGENVTETEKELVLREPQFRTVQAAEQAAKAAMKEAEVAKKTAETAADEARNNLRQAQLDLKRTVIQAPFNAVIQTRDVDLGATVSTTTPLATLIGTDEYWVEVPVPVDQLKWVRVPQTTAEEGSAVRVYNEAAWGADRFRTGRVCRLASDLEEQGRMARLLVCVPDPLALAEANRGQPSLLIGSYVRVEIEGQEIESAAAVNRSLLRDGDRVWVMNRDDRLEIRPVTVAFRSRDHVLVTGGIQASDRLVVTDLAAPVEGMPLRVRTDAGPAMAPAADKPRDAAAEGTPR